MTTSLKPIDYTVHTISDADYTIDYGSTKEESEMSFAERLAMQIEQANAKVTINRLSQPLIGTHHTFGKLLSFA